MVKRKPKSSAKRQREHDGKSSNKRHRPEPQASVVETPEKPQKIIDLFDECLETIFQSLGFDDLYNVAVANESLRPTARFIYRRKFGACKVRLYSVENIKNTSKPIYRAGVIIINDLKSCLQFLRCFGSSIGHLAIHYRESDSHRYDYVHQYINKYCSDSLVHIRFNLKPSFRIEHFDKPFVNVQRIEMFRCNLDEQFQQFFEWFPNVKDVKINGIEIVCRRFMDANPSQLEHLVINIKGNECANTAQQNKCITDLFNAHRQLQILKINVFKYTQMPLSSLLDMIKENQSISELTVNDGKLDHSNAIITMEIKRLIHEHPSLVELDLSYYRLSVDHVNIIIQRSIALKQFRFATIFRDKHHSIGFNLNGVWIASQQPGITTLSREW